MVSTTAVEKILFIQPIHLSSLLLFNLIILSRPATLPPQVTSRLRNQYRDQDSITASVILSTQVIDKSTDQ